MKIKRKLPGILWTFTRRKTGEQDIGILPSNYGESNTFALWKGGHWISRKFYRETIKESRQGNGNRGLAGRMSYLLERSRANKWQYNRHNTPYVPAKATPEELVIKWNAQGGQCFCGGLLYLLEAHLDHNHETGEVRGFLHNNCNLAEGCLSKMTDLALDYFTDWYKGTRSSERTKLSVNKLPKYIRRHFTELDAFAKWLRSATRQAKRAGHLGPITTPIKLLWKWKEQGGRCAACNELLEFTKARLDHSHKTGKFRGFICHNCNILEGFLSKMTDDEVKTFIMWHIATRKQSKSPKGAV